MVRVTLSFNNVVDTPNGIRFKYPGRKIAQSTHSALLKLTILPVEAHRVHLFDTLVSGSLLYPGKLFNSGCTDYFNAKNSTSSSMVKLSSKESDPPALHSYVKLRKTITSTKKMKKFNH